MYSLLCGNTKTNVDRENTCDIKAISSPDNLSMMQGHNELIIGEDTSKNAAPALLDEPGCKLVMKSPAGLFSLIYTHWAALT